MTNTPYHVRAVSDRVVGVHAVFVGTQDQYRCGPWFPEKDKAQRLAARIAAAFRQEAVSLEPVVVIPDGAALMTVITNEIEVEQEMIADSKGHELDSLILGYVETLRSIEKAEDGSVSLDADQALAVADALSAALEYEADEQEQLPGITDEPTPEYLRQCVRLMQAAGYMTQTQVEA